MWEREIAALTAAQHGLVSTDQLRELGVSAGRIRGLLSRGALIRDHQLVLRAAAAPITKAQQVMAATMSVRGAMASHLTAAEVLAFASTPRSHVVTITVGTPHHHDLNGVRVRRSNLIPPHHVTVVDGIRVSRPERTVLDLAADLTPRVLGRMIEQQYVDRRITQLRMEQVVREMAVPGRRGITRLCAVLDSIDGRPPAESELEARFLELIRTHGLPEPERQVTFSWSEREHGRVDTAWPTHRLIVELDGRRYHSLSAAFERDRRRDQLASIAGWRPIRFTWRQVVDAPGEIVATLCALLA